MVITFKEQGIAEEHFYMPNVQPEDDYDDEFYETHGCAPDEVVTVNKIELFRMSNYDLDSLKWSNPEDYILGQLKDLLEAE